MRHVRSCSWLCNYILLSLHSLHNYSRYIDVIFKLQVCNPGIYGNHQCWSYSKSSVRLHETMCTYLGRKSVVKMNVGSWGAFIKLENGSSSNIEILYFYLFYLFVECHIKTQKLQGVATSFVCIKSVIITSFQKVL